MHGGIRTPGGSGVSSGRKAEPRNVWMRSANRGNGNNVANVNSAGNCNNNNAINGNRVAPDHADETNVEAARSAADS